MNKDWQNAEEETNKIYAAYGCRRVPMSGSRGDEKLDNECIEGKLQGYRISVKSTIKASITVTLKDILKDIKQAFHMGAKVFRRIVLINPVTGQQNTFVLIEEDRFLELLATDE